VSTHEQRNQYLVEHLVLADDDLSNLRKNAVADSMEAVNAFLQLCGIRVEFSERGHRQFPFF
jgi:hypothetical protein